MTDRELMQQALDALEAGLTINDRDSLHWTKTIEALRARLAQPEYRRGTRLICLETDEFCVIHVSGENRQWVKFPDSHICVYTNSQIAELFDVAQPEPEQTRSQKLRDAGFTRRPKGWDKDGDEPEPVAWMYNSVGDTRFAKTLDTPGMHKDESVPLYTAPPQREWQGLTDEEIKTMWGSYFSRGLEFARAIEAKLKEKNNA